METEVLQLRKRWVLSMISRLEALNLTKVYRTMLTEFFRNPNYRGRLCLHNWRNRFLFPDETGPFVFQKLKSIHEILPVHLGMLINSDNFRKYPGKENVMSFPQRERCSWLDSFYWPPKPKGITTETIVRMEKHHFCNLFSATIFPVGKGWKHQ